MSNEFGVCANNLSATIKNDSMEKPIIMDRHCVNGPPPLPAPVVPPSCSTDIPRSNINVGSTSWNYNPYFGNFYNYYTSQTYDLGDVPHQYGNQKCGAQFSCNYQQPLAPNSVLQCCDPRCQLLSEQSKYPYSQALCSKSHQKSKRARGYYSGVLDAPKPDITSRPPPDYAASKYTPMVPYSTHMNDLNNKYSGQQVPYNMQYQTTFKSSKSLFLAEHTAYTNTEFAKQPCWNKQNLWNPNLSSSYYSSIQQNRSVNHKFPVPLLEQNGMPGAVKHNILHNHSTLEPRSTLYDSSYIPNYHYMNNRQNQMSNHEHRHMNEECSYSHFSSMGNGHQIQSTYNAHCSLANNGQDPYYKELLLKSSETAITKQHIVNKGPNLDVREFLSTWDEGEDERPPESEAPVIVLDCTSLEGDALAKVKEKLGNTISDCNSLGNSVTTICELGSQSNATVLKVVDDPTSAVETSKPTSVIQDCSSSNSKVSNCVKKSTPESSHLNSDGFMTWYSTTKKRDEHSYDLVEMTERLINSVDKLCGDPEKKNMLKSSGSLPNLGYQVSNQNVIDENYIENEWRSDFICPKRTNDVPSQNAASNQFASNASKYVGVNNVLANSEKPSYHSSMDKITVKPVENALPPVTNYRSASTVQDYCIKYKNNYKQCSDYYQPTTTNSSCQYYNPCYYADTNTNSCNVSGSNDLMGNNAVTKNNNAVNYTEHSNSDITQMKADLEKSLNEIQNDSESCDKKRSDVIGGNSALNDASGSPKTCQDLTKNILEIGMVVTESVARAPCTEVDIVTSHNGVVQKTGDFLSELNEDSGSCENSLLSMPSLSPPPTSKTSTTADECTKSNISDNFQKDDIQNVELHKDTSISKSEAEQPTELLRENVGNLNQPLNLAIDKDPMKLGDIELKVDRAVEERLTKDVEQKDASISESTDLNIGKADDGYFSIENHSDNDECHRLTSNNKVSAQSKDVVDKKVACLVPHETYIVPCKLYDDKFQNGKNQIATSSHSSNLKSKSAPPSVVDMTDVILHERPKQCRSLVNLQGDMESLIFLQTPNENSGEAFKLNHDASETVPNGYSSVDQTVIDSSENLKSNVCQPIAAEENNCSTSTVVTLHQEISSYPTLMRKPVVVIPPLEIQSAHNADQKEILLDKIIDVTKKCTKSALNASTSDEYNAIYPIENESIRSDDTNACPSQMIENIASSKLMNETTGSRTVIEMNKNSSSIVHPAYLNSINEVTSCIPRGSGEMNRNLYNSLKSGSLVDCHSKAPLIDEKQQFTFIQPGRSPADSQRIQGSTLTKSSRNSSMKELAKLPTSVIFSPPYSSPLTSVHAMPSEANSSDSIMKKVENDSIEYKLESENGIDGKRNPKKKFKHKKHRSKKSNRYTGPYENPRPSKDDDKLMKKIHGSDSVIKENTNLLNTNHSPLYPIRSVQDLEMKLSNIRQRLPNDTLLYKCAPRDSSPTNFEDTSSKIEETSESSACQNENDLPQNPFHFNNDIVISVVNNTCTSNESANSSTSENLKLGKHIFTHKNADLPMKKRRQDTSIYNCTEKSVNIEANDVNHSEYCSIDDETYNNQTVTRFNQPRKHMKSKRRFSYTEDPKSLLNKSNRRKIDKEYRRSKSLIDWYEDDVNSSLDSSNNLHSLSIQQQKYLGVSSVKPISISNPCISSSEEKEFCKSSISLPVSPSYQSQMEEKSTLQYSPLQHDEFSVNNRSSIFNDRIEENTDNIPDISYYDYNIPSVAPTPQCDLSKDDRFDSDLVETCDKSNSPEHNFSTSNTFDNSPVYNAPSTPNCDFSVSEDVNEDFINCVQSVNEAAHSECSFHEDPEKILSKAPSPCCMFSDVIIDDISEQNLYHSFTVLSPASSVAPSPQCDIIDGVILDNQDSRDSIAECDDNNNHHIDSVDCRQPTGRVICGVPTLQSLAFEALDGISTQPLSSNTVHRNNVLQLWVNPEHTEIIIHSENQQATTDILLSEMDNYVENSELYQETPITSDASMNETSSSLIELQHMAHIDEDMEDEQYQCIIISNDDESVIHAQDSSDSHTLMGNEDDLVDHINLMVDNTYINGCLVDDEFQFSNNCIEESFIDQKVSCSPPAETLMDEGMYESSSSSSCSIEMHDATTYASTLQMKVQLPWHKIFNLGDDLNNYDVGLLKELELGPAQIEVRLSSSGSKLWKVVNSKPEFLSSVLKVKRLILQPASVLNGDEDNSNKMSLNNVEPSVLHPAERIEVTDSDLNNKDRDDDINHKDKVGGTRQLRRGSRLNTRKKSKTNNINGIVGVPKMVIRKTSCREYQSFLRNSDFLLPVVRLNRYKCLDELALKIKTANSGGGSINIKDLTEITSPKRKLSNTAEDHQPRSVCAEGNAHSLVNQITQSNVDELPNVPRLKSVEICKKPKDAAVGVGTAALFPKPLPERHHCLLCHRTYSSEELYQLHVKSKLHRHLELTQRKTIHAMYRYFTGHLCPRLRPLSVVERKKMKWKPRKTNVHHFYHQKTPLQIALHKSVFHHRK